MSYFLVSMGYHAMLFALTFIYFELIMQKFLKKPFKKNTYFRIP